MATPRPLTTISLPTARAEQLRALAKTLDPDRELTIVELVERLINQAIGEGDLDDQLPGFDTFVNEHGLVVLMFGDIPPLAVSTTFARHLAETLREAAAPKSKARAVNLADGSLFVIARHATGVILARTPKPGAAPVKATMTVGMAADLARQIEKAAKDAERK
jgi:hypothetical protein